MENLFFFKLENKSKKIAYEFNQWMVDVLDALELWESITFMQCFSLIFLNDFVDELNWMGDEFEKLQHKSF